jgi:hypothetical protein
MIPDNQSVRTRAGDPMVESAAATLINPWSLAACRRCYSTSLGLCLEVEHKGFVLALDEAALEETAYIPIA